LLRPFIETKPLISRPRQGLYFLSSVQLVVRSVHHWIMRCNLLYAHCCFTDERQLASCLLYIVLNLWTFGFSLDRHTRHAKSSCNVSFVCFLILHYHTLLSPVHIRLQLPNILTRFYNWWSCLVGLHSIWCSVCWFMVLSTYLSQQKVIRCQSVLQYLLQREFTVEGLSVTVVDSLHVWLHVCLIVCL